MSKELKIVTEKITLFSFFRNVLNFIETFITVIISSTGLRAVLG